MIQYTHWNHALIGKHEEVLARYARLAEIWKEKVKAASSNFVAGLR